MMMVAWWLPAGMAVGGLMIGASLVRLLALRAGRRVRDVAVIDPAQEFRRPSEWGPCQRFTLHWPPARIVALKAAIFADQFDDEADDEVCVYLGGGPVAIRRAFELEPQRDRALCWLLHAPSLAGVLA